MPIFCQTEPVRLKNGEKILRLLPRISHNQHYVVLGRGGGAGMTLADYFLENERQVLWHPERNLPLRPEELSPGSHRRVWWQCVSGHSWQAQVYSVTIIGSGCPCCSGLKPIPGQTDLGTQRPDIARYWDGERNAPLTPRDVTSVNWNMVLRKNRRCRRPWR